MTTTALSEVADVIFQMRTFASAEPVAWSRTDDIADDDGCPIGTDEPRVVWGSEHPDPSETWFPLYGEPMLVTHDAQPAAKVEANPEAAEVCGEAYQVVGSLLSDLGIFNSCRARKILDNLSQQRMIHRDVLPWPSCAPTPARVPDWRQAFIENRKTRYIELGMKVEQAQINAETDAEMVEIYANTPPTNQEGADL